MDATLLGSLFGTDGRWSGPCILILDADANVQSIGSDAIVQGGIKAYAPRLITGRVPADHVLWLADRHALLLIKRTVVRQQSGEDIVNHTLQVVDSGHVAAVEFENLNSLARLGLSAP